MKKILIGLVSLFFVIALAGRIFLPTLLDKESNPVLDHLPFIVSDKARELHKTLIVGDWHSDSALWNRDLSKIHDYG
ncbi:peptidase M19, partial [bacterium]|nr:peptidase M19 [bacterium]